ncbi:hypothetical protein [Nocardia altamirensis]|uniref:hypothetical protein n=1 Tax=Nocardia altamirensis TaxID=472158 RepID=UPI00084007DC|nr:hypothetical protein [Nocardia altamirensis]
MASSIYVNPEGLRTQVVPITKEMRDSVRGILQELCGALDAAGQPWGTDKFGKEFAEGEHGYLRVAATLRGTVDDLSKALSDFTFGITKAAYMMDGQDTGSAIGFGAK